MRVPLALKIATPGTCGGVGFLDSIILNTSCSWKIRVLFAYHFDSSKVQDLGVLLLNYPGHLIDTTFIYTPCWAGDLSENN